MSVTTAEPAEAAARSSRWLPLWVGLGVYAFVLVTGNKLLIDPDTLWQVTVGQWIIDHHAVPVVDFYSFTMRGQPWISTQWLAQAAFAASFAAAGWAGPVVLTSAAAAVTFWLYAGFLARRLSSGTTIVFAAAALALMMPHLLARPHVLAMPVMVAWVAGLCAAADRRAAPSFWLLPLMTLWANLHGGFVLGLSLAGALALDALWHAAPAARLALALRWMAFGLAALAASCVTPYGWGSLLASQKILSLGEALALISEWRPADFSSLGALELSLLLGVGLALWRGITLPPLRIAMLLGLIHLALSAERNLELLALLAPLILAAPLARQIGLAEDDAGPGTATLRRPLAAGLALCLVAGTFAWTATFGYAPHRSASPVAAVAALKRLAPARVFNAYDFGGYLIANGVAPFIDGRTELYGEQFVVAHDKANRLRDPAVLFRLLADYDIDATLLAIDAPAAKLLDHVDGWHKVYADDVAVIHLRRPGARHTAEPRVDPARR